MEEKLDAILKKLDDCATKNDLKNFATKDDLKNFATKEDLKNFATKEDLKNFATKDDLKALREEFKAEFKEIHKQLKIHHSYIQKIPILCNDMRIVKGKLNQLCKFDIKFLWDEVDIIYDRLQKLETVKWNR